MACTGDGCDGPRVLSSVASTSLRPGLVRPLVPFTMDAGGGPAPKSLPARCYGPGADPLAACGSGRRSGVLGAIGGTGRQGTVTIEGTWLLVGLLGDFVISALTD